MGLDESLSQIPSALKTIEINKPKSDENSKGHLCTIKAIYHIKLQKGLHIIRHA